VQQLPARPFKGVDFQNGGDEHGKLLWPQVKSAAAAAVLACGCLMHDQTLIMATVMAMLCSSSSAKCALRYSE
jgi:hypothetical protein